MENENVRPHYVLSFKTKCSLEGHPIQHQGASESKVQKQTENEEGPETPEGVSKTNHKGRHWLCLLLLVGQPLFVFMSGAEKGRSRMEFMEKPKEPILNFLWNAIEWGVARTQRETMDGGGTQTGAGRGGGADEKGEWVGEELKIKGKENNQ